MEDFNFDLKRPRVSEKFRKAVVAEILSGETQISVSKKYNISTPTITTWLRQYGGLEYKERQRKDYSLDFKDKICAEINEGVLGVRDAQMKYNIKHDSTVRSWLRDYKLRNDSFTESINAQANMDQAATQISSDINLEKKLIEAQAKIRILEAMIEVAEQTYKIQIRKKYGAKQ